MGARRRGGIGGLDELPPSRGESWGYHHHVAFELTPRQRRWLDALLILSTIAVGFVVLGFAAQVLAAFGDLILVFFLAWLLAFIISPVVGRLATVPFLPRAGAVVVVYVVLLAALGVVIVELAGALAASISQFVASVPSLLVDLPRLLAPWQSWLNTLGLGQVDLAAQARAFVENLSTYAAQLAGPIQQLAVASFGTLGNLLLVFILSLYMVADRDRMVSYLFRLVPPAYKEEALLLESTLARSFGGFLRGQAIIGFAYGAVAALTSAALGLSYLPATSVAAGLFMAIPFFGPFVAWAPPIAVAIVLRPDAVLPAVIVMAVGWVLVMNVLQPRIMADALRIHPIVVLGSVLVGLKVAGIGGAIFGIPIAAVLSAFFLHWVPRTREIGPIAARAARRIEAREGRPVRVPREPEPGSDPDVDERIRGG